MAHFLGNCGHLAWFSFLVKQFHRFNTKYHWRSLVDRYFKIGILVTALVHKNVFVVSDEWSIVWWILHRGEHNIFLNSVYTTEHVVKARFCVYVQIFSCFKVKEIEKRDSVLTPKQQIDRLLRPGSTYFNLNPFEVLQLEPESPLDEIKKKYRRLSILVHPDKNMVSGYKKTVVLLVAVTLLVDLHSVSKFISPTNNLNLWFLARNGENIISDLKSRISLFSLTKHWLMFRAFYSSHGPCQPSKTLRRVCLKNNNMRL